MKDISIGRILIQLGDILFSFVDKEELNVLLGGDLKPINEARAVLHTNYSIYNKQE